MELTQARVRELFDYVDGQLFPKIRTHGRKPGVAVGCNSGGYLITMVEGKLYKVHRLVYLWHHGHMPKLLDHIDGNRSNNRIDNLREATDQQNGCNRGKNKNNKSGHKGVHYDKRRGKWQAQIMVNRKNFHVGYFDDPEEAHEAYKKAAANYHGDFARAS